MFHIFMPNSTALFPYFEENISVRLAKEQSQFRNLKDSHTVIDVEGSAWLYLKEINGLRSIGEIINKVSKAVGIEGSVLIADFMEILNDLKAKGILAISKNPKPQNLPFLSYVGDKIRSQIHFDITHKCNESCIHCLADKDKKEASLGEIKRIIKEAATLGFTSFSFSGGEPAIHPDFWAIIETTRDFGFYFTLFTNGVNWDNFAISRLSTMFPEEVRVSLYSMKPEIHEKVTNVKGSFAKTLANILKFRKAGLKVYINCPVMNINYEGYKEVAALCAAQGCRSNFDSMIQPARDKRLTYSHLQLPLAQDKEVLEFQQSAAVLEFNVKMGSPVCDAGSGNVLYINAGLEVYPCPGLRIKMGDLSTTSLGQVIQKNTLLTDLHSLSLKTLAICKTCKIRKGCNRCHGRAFEETGDYRLCSSVDRKYAKMRMNIIAARKTSNYTLAEM